VELLGFEVCFIIAVCMVHIYICSLLSSNMMYARGFEFSYMFMLAFKAKWVLLLSFFFPLLIM
jgi:hypothetical protein